MSLLPARPVRYSIAISLVKSEWKQQMENQFRYPPAYFRRSRYTAFPCLRH